MPELVVAPGSPLPLTYSRWEKQQSCFGSASKALQQLIAAAASFPVERLGQAGDAPNEAGRNIPNL